MHQVGFIYKNILLSQSLSTKLWFCRAASRIISCRIPDSFNVMSPSNSKFFYPSSFWDTTIPKTLLRTISSNKTSRHLILSDTHSSTLRIYTTLGVRAHIPNPHIKLPGVSIHRDRWVLPKCQPAKQPYTANRNCAGSQTQTVHYPNYKLAVLDITLKLLLPPSPPPPPVIANIPVCVKLYLLLPHSLLLRTEP